MNNTYKKRAKSSWAVGKSQKATSNSEERQYEKTEIEQAIKETDPSLDTLVLIVRAKLP